LETVDFGKNTRNIGSYAFQGCTSLVDLELPNSLLDSRGFFDGVYHFAIGKGAFSDCTALVEITLPVTLEIIEADAFGSELLTAKTPIAEEDKPLGWAENWSSAEIIWEWEDESITETDEAEAEKK
jgi:hypothetical protein